jgi:hypothetical protein
MTDLQARAVWNHQRRHESPQFLGIVVDDESHADRAEKTPDESCTSTVAVPVQLASMRKCCSTRRC